MKNIIVRTTGPLTLFINESLSCVKGRIGFFTSKYIFDYLLLTKKFVMKKTFITASIILLATTGTMNAQKLNTGKLGAVTSAAKALTISDSEIVEMAAKSVKWMDENNATCSVTDKDPKKKAYAQRLEKIFGPYKNYDGLKLNYKVYYVTDINAFAAPDGSIRVFSALMDIMTDDELLGIIGHEIGHVKLEHSKKGYKQALITAAAAQYAGSTKGSVADFANSDLGKAAEALTGAQFSQKQESASDSYSYSFLLAHNINPEALVTAFTKFGDMEKEANADTGLGKKMFSSHPDSEKRAKRISDRIKKEKK